MGFPSTPLPIFLSNVAIFELPHVPSCWLCPFSIIFCIFFTLSVLNLLTLLYLEDFLCLVSICFSTEAVPRLYWTTLLKLTLEEIRPNGSIHSWALAAN